MYTDSDNILTADPPSNKTLLDSFPLHYTLMQGTLTSTSSWLTKKDSRLFFYWASWTIPPPCNHSTNCSLNVKTYLSNWSTIIWILALMNMSNKDSKCCEICLSFGTWCFAVHSLCISSWLTFFMAFRNPLCNLSSYFFLLLLCNWALLLFI